MVSLAFFAILTQIRGVKSNSNFFRRLISLVLSTLGNFLSVQFAIFTITPEIEKPFLSWDQEQPFLLITRFKKQVNGANISARKLPPITQKNVKTIETTFQRVLCTKKKKKIQSEKY